MGSAPIRFRDARRSRVGESPRRAALIGGAVSAVRGDTIGRWWCMCLAATREGPVPKSAVREMSQSWWPLHPIRSGWTRAGGDRDHWPSSSRTRSPAFHAVALVSSRGAANSGAGAYLHDVRLRRMAVIHRCPRSLRVAARRPTLSLIRIFVGLISTDAPGHGVSALEPVRGDSLSRRASHGPLRCEKVRSLRIKKAQDDSSGWVGKVVT